MSPYRPVVWSLAVVAIVGVGLTVATAFDRAPPLLASSVEGHAAAPIYHPGDVFSGTWTAKAVRACDGMARRHVEVPAHGGIRRWVYYLPDVPVTLTAYAADIPGRVEYPITAFELPSDMPTGPARYFHVDSFVCSLPGNLLFPIEVVYQPIDFEVVPRPVDPAVPAPLRR